MQNKSSYRQIMKATSIFGGVQVFTILIAIIRSKVIAVLLGPTGIGIYSLLNSTTGFIGGLTNFGLATSSVKNVAAAHNSGDVQRVAAVVNVLQRLVWFTGLLGAVITIVLSPWLSQITFGNRDYTLAFAWISITLLLNQLSVGQTVILQGLRKLNYLAQSSLSGAILGLVVSLPVYYRWGVDRIVPAIIITSIANLIQKWYFAKKVKIEKVAVSRKVFVLEAKDMLNMGLMLSLSGLYLLAKDYGIRTYISNIGGMEEVGLYSAGILIVNTYVGMVFTAMSTDYFPRLSAVAEDNNEARKLINQQAEIAVLILAPLIIIFIIFIGWIVVLLYSNDFSAINSMIQWAMLGIFFKAASWSMGFVLLAKGKAKIFLFNELFGGTITLLCNVLGYYLGGLTGMGIGFLIGYFYYMLQVYFLTRYYFNFSFEKGFLRIFLAQIALAIVTFVIVLLVPKPLSYLLSIPIIVISCIYSYKELDHRLDLKDLLSKFKK